MQLPKTLTGLRGYDSIPDFAERSGTNPFKFKQVFKNITGKHFSILVVGASVIQRLLPCEQ